MNPPISPSPNLIEQFYRLVPNPPQKYGTQTSSNTYILSTANLTDAILKSHFNGDLTIDIKGDKRNCFGAYDVDIRTEYLSKDKVSESIMKKLRRVVKDLSQRLTLLGLNFLIEDSANRGFHVWLFFEEAISINDSTKLLLYILNNINLPKEISVEIKPNHVGDGLRLFYSIHRKTGKRTVFYDSNFEEYKGVAQNFLKSVKVNDKDLLIEIIDDININNEITQIREERKGVLPSLENLKRCPALKKIIEKGEKKESLGHQERKTLIMSTLPANSDELKDEVIGFFSSQPNYDPHITKQNMDTLAYTNYLSCKKIKEKGLCSGECMSIKAPGKYLYDDKEFRIDGKLIEPPKDYFLSNKYVTLHTYDSKGIPVTEIVTKTPIWLQSKTMSLEEETVGVVLAYLTSKSKEVVRTKIVDKRTISDAPRLLELADFDVDITSNNNKKMVDYLTSCYEEFKDILPLKYTTSKSGWQKKDGKYFFILGKKTYSDKGTENLQIEFNSTNEISKIICKGTKSKGSLDLWIKTIQLFMGYRNFMLGLSASFAAPLLHFFNVENFIIHLCNDSTKGKTTLLQLALSVFGLPVKSNYKGSMINQWRGTINAIECLAYAYSDTVLFMDESGQATPNSLAQMVYALANGTVKSRLSQNGENRPQRNFKNIILSTGEGSLISNSTTTGKEVRYIEVINSPFVEDDTDKKKIVEDSIEVLLENYGVAGEKYISRLIEIVNDKNQFSDFQKIFEIRKKQLLKYQVSNTHARNATNFALLWTGFVIANDLFKITDRLHIEKSFIELFKDAGKKWEGRGVSTVENAIGFVWDTIMSQRERFEANKLNSAPSTCFERLGVTANILGHEDSYAIIDSKLDEILIKGDFDPKFIKRSFKEKNYVVLDKDRQLPHVRFNSNVKKRSYVFHSSLVSFIKPLGEHEKETLENCIINSSSEESETKYENL